MKRKSYQYLLSFGHFCSDINQGSLSSILPFLIAAYNFDYQTAASLVLVSNVIGSVVQPLFGDLADRKNIPWSMAIGIFLAAGGMSLTGFMTDFVGLSVCVAISGIGSAMFHPQAARLINKVADKGHTGNSISIFSFGGNLGFTLGPIIITASITAIGLRGTGALILPALFSSGLILSQSRNLSDKGLNRMRLLEEEYLADNDGHDSTESSLNVDNIPLEELKENEAQNYDADKTSIDDLSNTLVAKKEATDQWKSFFIFGLFVFSRSIILSGMNTFLSLYFINELGQTEIFGNTMLSIYYATSTITTLFGGALADKYGYVKSVKIAFAILTLSMIAFSFGHSVVLCIIFMIPIACAMNLSYSPIIVLGQKYIPNHIGLASGLTMGLAMSLEGIFTPVLGMIADNNGLQMTISVLALFSIIPMIIVLFMPEPIE